MVQIFVLILSLPTGWPWKTEVLNIAFQHGLQLIKPREPPMKYHKPNEATHVFPKTSTILTHKIVNYFFFALGLQQTVRH